jgi:tRNA threonylcarbamoyladenosine biosynthesis protein TsaB|tara:strand:+ start:1048 stop:1758 length:711 start_codon:yes stop_codon:yes gene_type:complete
VTVLAFDTATSSCAITLWRNGDTVARAQQMLERGHAEVLVPMIEDVLAEAGLTYQELKLLAVTIGPGAFTGIRIGLATARALALASDLPLIGITNFAALAHAQAAAERKGRNILIVLETKRADFYACGYDENLSLIAEPQAIDGAGLLRLAGDMAGSGQLLLAGDCNDRAHKILQKMELDILISTSSNHVDPAIVAELAEAKFRSGTALDNPAPLYLKPPDVNMSGVKPPTRQINS